MGATMGIIQGGGNLLAAYLQSEAIRSKGDYDARMARLNSQISGIQATEAMERGDIAAGHVLDSTRHLIGAQRAAGAAQGLDVNSGSLNELQQNARTMGDLDALTVKNNAWREAWGYRVDAQNEESKAEMTGITANNQANNTLLTGGLQAAGNFGSAYAWGKKYGGGQPSGSENAVSDYSHINTDKALGDYKFSEGDFVPSDTYGGAGLTGYYKGGSSFSGDGSASRYAAEGSKYNLGNLDSTGDLGTYNYSDWWK